MKPFGLPAPSRIKQFRCAIDYTAPLEEFYEALAGVSVPYGQEESFQGRMLAMEPHSVVALAVECIALTIVRGSQTTGIGYSDIAHLHHHPEFRRSLYINGLHPRFESIYQPHISPTEQYHMDSLEGSMTDAVVDYFGEASRTAVKGEDDVILWRALLGCILETTRAISYAGAELGISEVALMNYAVTDILPHGTDTFTYLLVLGGP